MSPFDLAFLEKLREIVREEVRTALRDQAPTKSQAAQLLTVAQVSEITQRHPETVRRAIRKGILKATKPKGSRVWLVIPTEIDRWVHSAPAVDVQDAVEREISRSLGRSARAA